MPVVLAPAGSTYSTGHDIASHVRTSASVHAVTNGYGGFGGSAIALVPDELLSQVQVALDGAFAEHGYGQPHTFVVHPSDGATREP